MGIFNNIFRRDDQSATAQESTTPTAASQTDPEVNDVLLNALLRGDPITREQAMTIVRRGTRRRSTRQDA